MWRSVICTKYEYYCLFVNTIVLLWFLLYILIYVGACLCDSITTTCQHEIVSGDVQD